MDTSGTVVQPHDITDHLFGWVLNNYSKFLRYIGIFFILMAVAGVIFGVGYVWFPFIFLAVGCFIGMYISASTLRKPLLLIGFLFLVNYVVFMMLPGNGFSSPVARVVILTVVVVLYLGFIAFGILVAKDYYVDLADPFHGHPDRVMDDPSSSRMERE